MRKGFSLVELSIVLVILGLLVGGILAGQSLIRAAELRSVSTEYDKYTTAVMSFRDKYFALPGDFRDATRFWLRMNGNADCVTNSGAAQFATGVCDGNGNGQIITGGVNQSTEMHQFWRHLARAGLVEGEFSGTTVAASYHTSPGLNSPVSKFPKGTWRAQYRANYGDSWYYLRDYQIYMEFGGGAPPSSCAGGCSHFLEPILKPEEAWNIDTKMDDGHPAQGKLVALFWNNSCAVAEDGISANDDYAARYRLDSKNTTCALTFPKSF